MHKLILIFLLLTSSNSYAVWKNAESLLKDCESKSAVNKLFCSGYIAGVEDSLYDIFSLRTIRQDICIPKETPLSQRTKVFIEYAKKHPDNLQYTASSILHDALAKAFPCKQ